MDIAVFQYNFFVFMSRGIRGIFFRGAKSLFLIFFPGVRWVFFPVENSHFCRPKTNFSGFEKWKQKKKKNQNKFSTFPFLFFLQQKFPSEKWGGGGALCPPALPQLLRHCSCLIIRAWKKLFSSRERIRLNFPLSTPPPHPTHTISSKFQNFPPDTRISQNLITKLPIFSHCAHYITGKVPKCREMHNFFCYTHINWYI